jgi:MFS family permease
MMTPAALSILTTSFHTRGDRVKALGAWGGMGAVSGASGVLFGGVLTSEVSWRWVFFVNLPMVAVILVASFRLIDGERPKAPPLRDFDTVGAGLITGGMLLLVYALVNAPNVGWGTARTLGELAGAVVLIVLFLFNEQRHSNPLVPLSLFKIKDLWEADVTQVLAWAAFYTMFFLVTLYMEEVLHYSAIRTGLLYLPLTAGIGLGAGVATKGIPKIGTRPLIATGALLGAAGVFLLSRVPLHGTYLPDILPGMMIMGAGLGLVMVGVQNAANGGVPADKAGLAASLITASFQLGAALGLAIFVSLATVRTSHLLATHTQPSEALTLGFQRGLLGASIALVIAALIALRAPNVRVADMAPGADDNQARPVPVAGGPAPEAPHFPAGRAGLPGLPGRAAEVTAVPAHRKSTLPGTPPRQASRRNAPSAGCTGNRSDPNRRHTRRRRKARPVSGLTRQRLENEPRVSWAVPRAPPGTGKDEQCLPL